MPRMRRALTISLLVGALCLTTGCTYVQALVDETREAFADPPPALDCDHADATCRRDAEQARLQFENLRHQRRKSLLLVYGCIAIFVVGGYVGLRKLRSTLHRLR